MRMIMKKTRPTGVLQTIVTVLICFTTCGCLKWLPEEDKSFLFVVNDVIDINCTLDDPTVNVTLWVAKKASSSLQDYRQVFPNGVNIIQSHQIFRLLNVAISNSGQYQCRAKTMTPFQVLRVHVSHDGPPKPKPKISVVDNVVAYGKEVKLQCSAFGPVDLAWYKSENGTVKKWRKINTEESVTSNMGSLKETKRLLIIKKFNFSDNGVYRCELERKAVNWKAFADKKVDIGEAQKPNFTKFPEPVITMTVMTESVEFEKSYKVEGTPFPTITWYKVNGDKSILLSKCSSNPEEPCSFPKDHFLDISRSYFLYYLKLITLSEAQWHV
ncbi:hemicentin-1-like [Dendronephthya gigantea]|uniref:hemicentin-1-like n=1 Tax=Dendronephthya gigantea TaxID=151771 RepID=UPI00106A7D79|nr:hemicentin-1-like [Dendronephthya gigantea]